MILRTNTANNGFILKYKHTDRQTDGIQSTTHINRTFYFCTCLKAKFGGTELVAGKEGYDAPI